MSPESETTKTIHDDASDYGDFTLDEQEILNELLANTIPGTTTVADEPLELTDIEDYEEPKGVRLPKTLGKAQWIPPWMQQQPQAQNAAQFTVEDKTSRDNLSATKSRYISLGTVIRALTC